MMSPPKRWSQLCSLPRLIHISTHIFPRSIFLFYLVAAQRSASSGRDSQHIKAYTSSKLNVQKDILSPAVECVSFPDAIHMGNDTQRVGGGRYNHIEGRGKHILPLLLLALCTRNNVSVRKKENFFPSQRRLCNFLGLLIRR